MKIVIPKPKKRLSLRRIVLDFIDQERTLDECTKHARSVGWCPSKDDRRLRASVQDALSYFCRAGYVMRIGPSLFCPASNPPKRKSVKIHHRDEEEILALTVEPHVIELAKKPLKRNGKIKKAEEVQREIKCLTILLDNALPTASKYGIMLAWMEATQMKACNFYSRRNRLTPTYKKKYKNLPSGERTFVVDEK